MMMMTMKMMMKKFQDFHRMSSLLQQFPGFNNQVHPIHWLQRLECQIHRVSHWIQLHWFHQLFFFYFRYMCNSGLTVISLVSYFFHTTIIYIVKKACKYWICLPFLVTLIYLEQWGNYHMISSIWHILSPGVRVGGYIGMCGHKGYEMTRVQAKHGKISLRSFWSFVLA